MITNLISSRVWGKQRVNATISTHGSDGAAI